MKWEWEHETATIWICYLFEFALFRLHNLWFGICLKQLAIVNFQVFLCFGNSVASTRFLLQDEFNIQTTQCDNCIIVLSLFLLTQNECLCESESKTNPTLGRLQGFMFCLSQVACIFSIVACLVGSDELSEASQILSCCADMVYCTYVIFRYFPSNLFNNIHAWLTLWCLILIFLQGLCVYADATQAWNGQKRWSVWISTNGRATGAADVPLWSTCASSSRIPTCSLPARSRLPTCVLPASRLSPSLNRRLHFLCQSMWCCYSV